MKKTILYLRVSTEEQANNGQSLQNQLDKLTTYANQNGLDNVEVIKDAGFSGRTTKREGFKRMVTMVEADMVSHLIVYSLSRFARNVKDTIITVEKLNKHNVNFISITEQIDTRTAHGKFFITVLSGLAQLESDIMGARIKDVLQYKKSQNEVVGAIPFGYNRKGNSLVKNKSEQYTINMIKSFRERGLTFQEIKNQLTLHQRPNKNGTVKWHKSNVFRIFQANV